MQANSPAKHLCGRGGRSVKQQFRPPSKIILLTRIQSGGTLIFSRCAQGITHVFEEITERTAQVRFVSLAKRLFIRQHLTRVIASFRVFAASPQSQY